MKSSPWPSRSKNEKKDPLNFVTIRVSQKEVDPIEVKNKVIKISKSLCKILKSKFASKEHETRPLKQDLF